MVLVQKKKKKNVKENGKYMFFFFLRKMHSGGKQSLILRFKMFSPQMIRTRARYLQPLLSRWRTYLEYRQFDTHRVA
jgi:hypothetical protein